MRDRVAAAVVLCAWLAVGCASPQGSEANYESWLAPWQGASEEALRARFGKPDAEEQVSPTTKRLTYVINRPPSSGGSTIGFSIGGFGIGGGGHTAVGGGVGVTAPLNPGPSTCTTTFLLENGKVLSWTYEGKGCR